jgi:hypothetical protein
VHCTAQQMAVTQQVTIGKWMIRLGVSSSSSNGRIWMQRQGEKLIVVINYRNLHAPGKSFMK